ncbi:sulfite exporter TauE/SafE family protein [Alteromonas oceanisediminis]|uniref:sulfite exporter TauE/SafE family protein n=1 Tax=Alteromonas oceanisediminis TaxID=2836180 RepID=UPI001BD919E4|nr:sulfite exporter TauE/SafE family protein [Alteromonas oceanisediminis]MBT0585375.1 sulfite exporter TauE/SafE family protein [Alteromonas oceanisediminis]
MEMMLVIVITCMLLGAVVGVLAGLLGIGGGLIMVPALAYLLAGWLNIPPTETIVIAIATSLSTIIFTGMSSARAHYKLGNLSQTIVLWSGIGIAFGAIIGAQVASRIPGAVLKGIFAVLVMLIALYMMFGSRRESTHTASQPKLVGIGASVGTLSALMGIGGGALLVPALVWYRVNIRQAIGCAAFSGILIAVFGSASFVISGWHYGALTEGFIGYVFWPASVSIAVISVFTAPLGAKLGQRMNTQGLKKVFAVFLVLVSIRMLWGL